MKPWNRIKAGYRRFVKDESGQRFFNLHRRLHARHKRPAVILAGILAGVILIAGGVLLGLVPGVPGVVLVILGVGLIAAQFPVLAKACDRLETAARRLLRIVAPFRFRNSSQT
jgi:hypothetical protein